MMPYILPHNAADGTVGQDRHVVMPTFELQIAFLGSRFSKAIALEGAIEQLAALPADVLQSLLGSETLLAASEVEVAQVDTLSIRVLQGDRRVAHDVSLSIGPSTDFAPAVHRWLCPGLTRILQTCPLRRPDC